MIFISWLPPVKAQHHDPATAAVIQKHYRNDPSRPFNRPSYINLFLFYFYLYVIWKPRACRRQQMQPLNLNSPFRRTKSPAIFYEQKHHISILPELPECRYIAGSWNFVNNLRMHFHGSLSRLNPAKDHVPKSVSLICNDLLGPVEPCRLWVMDTWVYLCRGGLAEKFNEGKNRICVTNFFRCENKSKSDGYKSGEWMLQQFVLQIL